MDTGLPDIMLILSKYIPDNGIALEIELGSRAMEKAGDIVSYCLAQLRRTPKGAVLAAGFEQDPTTYGRPVELELKAAIESEPAFAARLKGLLAQYHHAAETHNN